MGADGAAGTEGDEGGGMEVMAGEGWGLALREPSVNCVDLAGDPGMVGAVLAGAWACGITCRD